MIQNKANARIRQACKENNLKLWEVADLLGVCAQTLTLRMRHEMPEEEQSKIIAMIIDEAEKRKETL